MPQIATAIIAVTAGRIAEKAYFTKRFSQKKKKKAATRQIIMIEGVTKPKVAIIPPGIPRVSKPT